jgi:transposase
MTSTSASVKNWVARFRTGHWSTEDKKHSGRPTQGTIPENVEEINSMIVDDRIISAEKTAETVAMSRERVGYIIQEILDINDAYKYRNIVHIPSV